MQDTDLCVLDVSYNRLTVAACDALSAALAKPQAVRCVGPTCPREGIPGKPIRGFHASLQELNLSGNNIGELKFLVNICPLNPLVFATPVT